MQPDLALIVRSRVNEHRRDGYTVERFVDFLPFELRLLKPKYGVYEMFPL